MNFQVYIYGRTKYIDYRELCVPAIDISPETKKLVSQLINVDVATNGTIIGSRFLFVRDNGYILMGIGFVNKNLIANQQFIFDKSKKRSVRSFVGIVITEKDFLVLDKLPISDDFFINLYLKYVPQLWDLQISQKNSRAISSSNHYEDEQQDWISQTGKITFNSNPDICYVFPKENTTLLLSSLHSCQSNIMFGLNNSAHVTTAFRRFGVCINNAVVFDAADYSILQLSTRGAHNGSFTEGEIIRKRRSLCKEGVEKCKRWLWEYFPRFGGSIQKEEDAVQKRFNENPSTQNTLNDKDFERVSTKQNNPLPAFLDGVSFSSSHEDTDTINDSPQLESMEFNWGDNNQDERIYCSNKDEETMEKQFPNKCEEPQTTEISHQTNEPADIPPSMRDSFDNEKDHSNEIDDTIPIWSPQNQKNQ